MANLCEVCGKSTTTGMNVSHSHIRSKRTWKPNIQRVRAIVDGETKRVNVCTRCLRSDKITRAEDFEGTCTQKRGYQSGRIFFNTDSLFCYV